MSQSDPTLTPKYLAVEVRLRFRKGDNLETLAGQMQKECDKILCVIDGCQIQYYHDCNGLPATLIFEHKQRHKKSDIMDYYYRCAITDSLYAFFLEMVHNYLKTQEETNCVGKIVKVSAPRNNANIKTVMVQTH